MKVNGICVKNVLCTVRDVISVESTALISYVFKESALCSIIDVDNVEIDDDCHEMKREISLFLPNQIGENTF